MVEWTEDERAIINSMFATLDYEDVGSKALARYNTVGVGELLLRIQVEGCETVS